jgi:hypothetical protein
MITKRGENVDYLERLEKAMYDREKVTISTKERGNFIGVPHSADECETDEERFGFYIETGEHKLDTVFLDEIIAIEVRENFTPINLELAAGK